MWLQELGRLPTGLWPQRVHGQSLIPEPREQDFMTTNSVFGELRHAKPVVKFSHTKARWDRGPMPPGSSPLEWDNSTDEGLRP
jgi:hypothetical protein